MQTGGTGPGVESPGAGQGIGQRRLLVEELTGPVPDPTGLDQHHQGVITEQVGDQLLPSNAWYKNKCVGKSDDGRNFPSTSFPVQIDHYQNLPASSTRTARRSA